MTSQKSMEAGPDQAEGTETKDGGDAQETSDDLSQVTFDELLEKVDEAQRDALLKLLNIC